MTEDREARTSRKDRRLFWGIFALVLLSYAYFGQGGGWNENSRMDLTRAVVHHVTLSIDEYHQNTGDKSRVGGHYYSDKAPGLSFLAVPAYFASLALRGLFRYHDFIVFASYLVTLLTAGVAGALGSALVYRAARRFGATPRGSALAAVGYGLGTTVFAFSTMLFSHVVVALLLFAAFIVAWEGEGTPSTKRLLTVGLLAATAVLVEYPSAPAAAIIGLYASGLRVTRRTALLFAAAAVPVLALAVYLTFAFGGPASVGYGVLADPGSREEMRSRGVFGMTYPHLGVIVELLLGRYRGILPYSPLLFLAFPGFARLLFDGREERAPLARDRRRAALLCAVMVAYYLLFASSYTWWQGGSSFGSRHVIPMLPFFVTPVAMVASQRWRLAFLLLLPSIAAMTIVTAVQPKPSDQFQDPFWRGIFPAFVRGRFASNDVCNLIGQVGSRPHEPFVNNGRYDAFNLGMALGAKGHRSLVPLYALWLTAVWAFGRATRDESMDEGGGAEPEAPEQEQAPARP